MHADKQASPCCCVLMVGNEPFCIELEAQFLPCKPRTLGSITLLCMSAALLLSMTGTLEHAMLNSRGAACRAFASQSEQ